MADLVRYTSTGPLVSLRGVIGHRLPDGRVMMRGRARLVPDSELEAPTYWTLAGDEWRSHDSWAAAVNRLACVLDSPAIDVVRACDEREAGIVLYAPDIVMLLPGGSERPC